MAIANDEDRARGWSEQLTQAHDTLRSTLVAVRAELGSNDGDSGDLLAHCLAFCSALTAHHVGEDQGLFAQLRQTRPDLEPALTNLIQDHQLIGGILTAVRGLAVEATEATSERRDAISGELDGLGAIVESHFRYEERVLRTALDAVVPDPSWRQPVFEPAGSTAG